MKFLSNVIASGSGSFGGTCVSRNRYGMYMRSRVVPVDPASALQSEVRSVFAQLVDAWVNELSAAERSAWETYAANVPLLGSLGNQQFVTGQNHYVRVNTCAIQAGLARVDAAPTVFDLGSLTAPTYTPDASLISTSVAFTATDAWNVTDGGALLAYQGQPQNPGRTFYKGPFRFIGSILGDTALPPSTPQTFSSPYSLAAGQRVFYYVRAIQPDGRLSSKVYGQALVQA